MGINTNILLLILMYIQRNYRGLVMDFTDIDTQIKLNEDKSNPKKK